VIVAEELDQSGKRWMLDFQMGAKVRRLVYYYERDYVTQPWPPGIENKVFFFGLFF
jgi:hypothetical protein